MANISVKYRCGDNVRINHQCPTGGIVTAIFIRDKGRAYEVSYTGENGPTNCVCQEVELAPLVDRKFGL